ncbi:MAG TPA: hypothetical protein VKA60_05430 [Blastocatellia bacterium]|nr:hypothetical protein [Blastocatellia bacterium]
MPPCTLCPGGTYVLSGNFTAGLEYHHKAVAGLESLVQSDPNNAVVAGDLAYAHSLIANTHERMADAAGSRNQRVQHWREAKGWYQKSLSGWLGLESRGTLANADKGEPERIRQAIAKCDTALQSR